MNMKDLDVFCSQMALECLKLMTVYDIADCLKAYDAPENHIIVTDYFSAVYLMNKFDFRDYSRLLKNNKNFTTVEHFENGIPEWLDPVPGTRIYLAEWTDDNHWELTKVSGI